MKFNTDYRIKHTLTRKYLAVVDCQHKSKGPDGTTCVDCVKGVPLQVSARSLMCSYSNPKKKSWTIVHGFHHIKKKKSWTIVHGFHHIFWKNHGL